MQSIRLKRILTVLLYISAVCATPGALAAGFYLTEIGSPGSLGTAGAANSTNTRGADSSWTNPAGMTGIDSDVMLTGLQLVLPKVEFDSSTATGGGNDGGNAGKATAIPSFFYVNRLSERFRLGFSIAAPLGGGVDYGDKFVGRYAVSKAELGGVGLSPSFGYRVNDRFSIGAGVTFLYTQLNQNVAINLNPANPSPATDAKLRIDKADDWGYQPFLGMTYRLSGRTLLGVVYRAEADVDLRGDVNIRNWSSPVIPQPTINKAQVKWDNPQWLDVGLRYSLDDSNILFLNGGWQDWSQFSKNGIAFDGGANKIETEIDRQWNDTWYARIGFLHAFSDQHAFSLGLSYDSSPVKNKDRTFDFPVDEYYKLSAAYGWTGKNRFDYSLGATLLLAGDARINETAQGVTAKGEFDTNRVLILGGTLRYRF